MSDNGMTAKVSKLPLCDLCSEYAGIDREAQYDGSCSLLGGSWAYMCEGHMKRYGYGLGLGRGQRLIVKGE